MEIKLSKKESMEIFHTAMCNGLGYIQGYGIILDADRTHYNEARDKLTSPCYEDVFQQILLDGNPIVFIDEEAEETHQIYLKDVYKKVSNTPLTNLMNIINETDDAIDSDCVLQTVIFDDVIYG